MTIIVTGGAGFIGSNFIFHMLNKYPDYRIICLDCLTYAGNLSTLEPVMDNPNFRFVKESITDRAAVEKLFEVKVLKVNTRSVQGKEKRVGAHTGFTADWKKAIVTIDTNPGEAKYLSKGGKEVKVDKKYKNSIDEFMGA